MGDVISSCSNLNPTSPTIRLCVLNSTQIVYIDRQNGRGGFIQCQRKLKEATVHVDQGWQARILGYSSAVDEEDI